MSEMPEKVESDRACPWSSEGVDFLRRVLGREVYTGLSGEALALWAVGLYDRPGHGPADRSDMARCMNVYWSAPTSLRSKLMGRLKMWSQALANAAGGEHGWRYGGPLNFATPRYYRREDSLDDYWSPSIPPTTTPDAS